MPGGVEIVFEPRLEIVAGAFFALAEDFTIQSMYTPLQRAIEQVAAPKFRNNFDTQGGGSWQPLADTTVEMKSNRGQSSDPLVATGTLRQAAGTMDIWTIDGAQGTAQVNKLEDMGLGYGYVHQSGAIGGGGNVIPARPWAELDSNDEEKIAEVFGIWVDERIALLRI